MTEAEALKAAQRAVPSLRTCTDVPRHVTADLDIVRGKFQDSCRLVIQARYALDFEDALSYSGLRQTTRMGSQLRVFPDQRSGWRRRAAS